jgi:glycosyltransferase involved in cell wall biosynthesis
MPAGRFPEQLASPPPGGGNVNKDQVMRIGVDIRNITMGRATGAGQFLLHCYSALCRYDRQNVYVPYHAALGRFGLRGPLAAATAALTADMISKHVWIPFWARKQKIDAMLYLLSPCSFTESSIPQICYILDIPQPWENYRLDYKINNDIFVRYSCHKADALLTISQFSAEQIVAKYHIPRERIHVIYPCIDLDVFCPRQDTTELQGRLAERGVRPGYLLGVVSRIIPRKNPGAYLEAFRRLPVALRRERKLVLAGGARTLEDFRPFVGEETLQAVRDDVVIMGRVSDDDLARLYTMAGASLFLSNYEGFGLPVVEALACGTEVIASDIPAIREAASSSTFLFNPDDAEGVARCTERVLTAPVAEREARRATGAAWVQRFSYATYAETLSGLLGRILA